MSGKPYSIGELKIIVDYLVENKLYSEIKARKMWVDFANTKLTTRTWQSLKETFLKRILPDIHNPYFKLTNEQISSFRARCNLADKNKNKLDIQTISDESNSNGHNLIDNELSNDEGENTTGENIQCSKIPLQSRSSADTVILENCYETAEEIRKELESTETFEKPISKSLRDCITYSEPLTPILQEVLDDFASEPEDSDREGQMEIVDSVPENDNTEDIHQIKGSEISNQETVVTDVAKNAKGLSAEVVEEVLAQEFEDVDQPESSSPSKTRNLTDKTEELPVTNSNDVTENEPENSTKKGHGANAETLEATKFFTAENTENPVVQDSEITEVSVAHDSEPIQSVQSSGLNNSNSTVDASLPNNPEALKTKQSKNTETNKDAAKSTAEVSKNSDKTTIPSKTQIPSKTRIPSKATKRRSYSVDNSNTVDSKKKKLEIMLMPSSKKPTAESHLDKNDDQLKANDRSKPGTIKKPQLTENAFDPNKPSTSFETHVVNETRGDTVESAKIINPCLQNVSLFDEQFNKNNYNMSESSDTEQNKKETQGDKPETTVSTAPNDTVNPHSHTESDTEEVRTPLKKKNRAGVLSTKSERDKAIANMFGFTSGGVGSKRKRQLSRRRRTVSHNNASHHNATPARALSNSSDWTSESESDAYVSPPRSRRNRTTRKYLKPKASKILSLEEEGGLFVMYGKKIYPLVKDGKIVKNYITYLPESESEEGESFWKLKYVEEKKKATELKKLLEKANEPHARDTTSPILQARPFRNSRSSHHQAGEPTNGNGVGTEICLSGPEEKKEAPKLNPPEKIKIKFTRNNEEVHLEGHWPQIHPVLEQVVQIFHKEVEPVVSDRKSKMIVENPDNGCESGHTTPIIITPVEPGSPEIHEKVNNIEKEIFMEIAERDKEEENEPNGAEGNVTKRKLGRPRKSSSSTNSPEKQQKTSSVLKIKESEENHRTRRQKTKETEDKAIDNQENVSKRQPRTPRKLINETVNLNDSKTIQTRRAKMLDTSMDNNEDVKYMLPPRNTRQSLKLPTNKKTNQKPQKSSQKAPKIFSSPDNISLHSMDSTQGYQDSDISPFKAEIKKKKKLDATSYIIKTRNSLRRSTRRRSHPYLHCDAYNDSSQSPVDAPVKVVSRENSSLNTEAYRSESYQLLMPRAKGALGRLESIDETAPIGNETFFVKHLESMYKNEMSAQINNFTSNSGQITSDIGSSSNISLPMSPELSVVENMSVSKELLNSIEDFPTINEIQNNETREPTLCNKYMISDVDVSVPLMQQECEFQSCNTVLEVAEPEGSLTESLLNKLGTINIDQQATGIETLDKKLHDMLLESAKKMTRSQSAQKKESMMAVDVTSVEIQKKTKANKKRCSTPQKRKGSKKSVAPKVDPVVEEEHVESWSHNGRKSCPPLFQTYLSNQNYINEVIDIANEKPKGRQPRKKKDVIKVKIQRPKNRITKEKHRAKSGHNASKISVFTDSGINDTESEVFLAVNDSVDLIHNHSETCLHANECVGDSIEFVKNSKSVITLGDSMQSGDNAMSRSDNNDEHSTPPDFFCNNAQDVSFYNKANIDNMDSASDTVYHSPLGTEASHNSLITEDLSDDSPQHPARPTKWYLLSEDDTNTNMIGQRSTMLNSGSYGSNLKQLFPIACAIPDLSTITEISRENDSSSKPTLEDLNGLTGDDFNSQSIFDSNL